jgi:CheY-like chemotaxis protein
MSPTKSVLLIDDSATIRRLVDTELSAAGYHVLLAPNAEEGLEKAKSAKPDLIILDHQLPGTTGYQVCCQLLADPLTALIPIVASSTLRKKAYSEYVDCDNVVDMLPKPYTAEVLVATVENAINTASLVVQSQSAGSAVPEVIDELGEAELSGTFGCFSLREVIDLLTNGGKQGMLEINAANFRAQMYTDRGRIQAVTAAGIDPQAIISRLPEGMSELAPIVKLTLTGRKGSEADGLVELLDNKVLDPRLLRKLIRLQAAVLLRLCFREKVRSFRFENQKAPSRLFSRLPLDSSLVALLVEAELAAPNDELPAWGSSQAFSRMPVRGQSFDRAGLSSKHLQMMKFLQDGVTLEHICRALNWSDSEARAVLAGFVSAELVRTESVQQRLTVLAVSRDESFKKRLSTMLQAPDSTCEVNLLSDVVSLGVCLRRKRPDVIVIDVDHLDSLGRFLQLKSQQEGILSSIRLIAACQGDRQPAAAELAQAGFEIAINKSSDAANLARAILGKQNASVQHPSSDSNSHAAELAGCGR